MGYVIDLKADSGLVDRSENTVRFYRDVYQYKPMTRDEEIKWFTLLKNGTEEEKKIAREAIIKANQRIVIAVAKKYADTDTLMDYTNEINIGLMRAIDKFDVTKGVKFVSFAIWYMKLAVNEYNNSDNLMVRRSNQSKTFSVTSQAINKFVQEHHREPTEDELMDVINENYGKELRDKNDLLSVQLTRIDKDFSDPSEIGYNDYSDFNEASSSINEYEDSVESEYNKKLCGSLLEILSPREQKIIKMKFGLYEKDGMKREYEVSEIADEVGVTKERVRQMITSILDRLGKEYKSRLSKEI